MGPGSYACGRHFSLAGLGLPGTRHVQAWPKLLDNYSSHFEAGLRYIIRAIARIMEASYLS